MRFKGTIVITDPCYLDSDMPNSSPSENWWDMVQYGDNLEASGINHYICESTVYGDWSCFTYKGTKEDVQRISKKWNRYYMKFFTKYNRHGILPEEQAKLAEEYRKEKQDFTQKHTYGKFCADAGMVCVVYLEDILKFNPNFRQWADKHPWCVTIINDFDGDVTYEIDEDDEAHIVGVGNINFYTAQSGL